MLCNPHHARVNYFLKKPRCLATSITRRSILVEKNSKKVTRCWVKQGIYDIDWGSKTYNALTFYDLNATAME